MDPKALPSLIASILIRVVLSGGVTVRILLISVAILCFIKFNVITNSCRHHHTIQVALDPAFWFITQHSRHLARCKMERNKSLVVVYQLCPNMRKNKVRGLESRCTPKYVQVANASQRNGPPTRVYFCTQEKGDRAPRGGECRDREIPIEDSGTILWLDGNIRKL